MSVQANLHTDQINCNCLVEFFFFLFTVTVIHNSWSLAALSSSIQVCFSSFAPCLLTSSSCFWVSLVFPSLVDPMLELVLLHWFWASVGCVFPSHGVWSVCVFKMVFGHLLTKGLDIVGGGFCLLFLNRRAALI